MLYKTGDRGEKGDRGAVGGVGPRGAAGEGNIKLILTLFYF